jgi:glycine/D-amino acid oxidase-like deaminating enzyme
MYGITIIGGGFYGGYVAQYLAKKYPWARIAILEKEKYLFSMASRDNLGQLHLGYLYSSTPSLAHTYVKNVRQFERIFAGAIDREVTTYYGVHRNSKVDAQAYELFCRNAALPITLTKDYPNLLFNKIEVPHVYRTHEKTFNWQFVSDKLDDLLRESGVDIMTEHNVDMLTQAQGKYQLLLASGREIQTKIIINASYAGINELHAKSGMELLPMQYDRVIHFNIEIPEEYKSVAAWVISGDFALLSPSQFRKNHILASGSHRNIAASINLPPQSNDIDIAKLYESAKKEATNWIPVLKQAKYLGYTTSLSTKPLVKHKGIYAPEVMFLPHYSNLENYHVLLGGKVGCLPEAIEKISSLFDNVPLMRSEPKVFL